MVHGWSSLCFSKQINLGWVPSAAILQVALPAGPSTAGVQTQCSIHNIVLLDIHSGDNIHIIKPSATKFHCIVVLHGVTGEYSRAICADSALQWG